MNINSFTCGDLEVAIYPNKEVAGAAGAAMAADELRAMLAQQAEVAVLFAAAISQDQFLAALRDYREIDWNRVTVFHLDEYAAISPDHPASFRRFLRERLLDYIPVHDFHQLNSEAADLEAECKRYAALLRKARPGLVALGIGENGHLAFIDPHSCNFSDPEDVRLVELDHTCRLQQIHDGAFARFEDVPRAALSVTIPVLLRVPRALVFVNGASKSIAVQSAIEGPINENCPASILRKHRNAMMFLDQAATADLRINKGI